MIAWQDVLMLNIVAYATAVILIKLSTNKLPRAQAISFQFFCCFLIVAAYRMYSRRQFSSPNSVYLLIMAMGVVNSFGAYCQWRAVAISQSRTAFFDPLSEIVSVGLAIVLLNEIAEWNAFLAAGVFISILAAYVLISGKEKEDEKKVTKKWLGWAIGMVIIFGVTTFLMKVVSFKLERSEFLVFWYLGSFMGSWILLYAEKQNPFSYPGKLILIVPILSFAIVGNLATEYWGFQLTEASRVLPFRSSAERFIPVFVGLFLFSERKHMRTWQEKIAFALSMIAAVLIWYS